eukprot:6210665-Pleurochrysis_carterae.AAC.6
MNGSEADTIIRARELMIESMVTFAEHVKDEGIDTSQQTWSHTWSEFLRYAQRGDGGETAGERADTSAREPYQRCTLERLWEIPRPARKTGTGKRTWNSSRAEREITCIDRSGRTRRMRKRDGDWPKGDTEPG